MTYGWIIYNGSLPGDKFLDFAQWLQTAAKRAGSTADIMKNNDLLTILGEEELGLLNRSGLPLPDYVLFTDKDLYLARQLELMGIPVFNSARAIEISDDKIATHQALALRKLPMPLTIAAPKTFLNESPVGMRQLDLAAKKLGFPMIVKEAFGSFGEQVYLVHDLEELSAIVKQIGGRPFMFQQFVKTSFGRDLRIQVAGNEAVAAMKRTAIDDFRANVTNGGKMAPHEPTEQEKKLAIAAAKAIGADFAGVDLLYGENDEPLVCEVNSNAHIHNLFDCTGINAADYIVRDVLEKVKKGLET